MFVPTKENPQSFSVKRVKMWNVSFERGRMQCRHHSDYKSVVTERFFSSHIDTAVAPRTHACSTVSWSHMSVTALHSNMPFYKVPVQAVVVSAQNIGLRCDYGKEILKYSSTSKEDALKINAFTKFRVSPRSTNTPLSSAEPFLQYRRQVAVNSECLNAEICLLMLGLIWFWWSFQWWEKYSDNLLK